MTTQLIYDNYEINPCRRFERPGTPGCFDFEVCEPAEADVWTLYGHMDGQGVEAIGDFPTQDDAERVYLRITGEPFTGSYEASPRLRLMRAAPALLDLAMQLVSAKDTRESIPVALYDVAVKVIASLEDSQELMTNPDIHTMLAHRQQIGSVWAIEDVQGIRPDLTNDQAWQVLENARRYHDASIGINWDVLSCHADMLFGDAPEPDDNDDEEA